MKKIIKSLLVVLMSSLALGFVFANVKKASAAITYNIASDVDFVNSQGDGYIYAYKDGTSTKATFKTASPTSGRFYYGASSTELYRVNLTNFTMKYQINSMVSGASYWIAFMKNWDDFPMDAYGTGMGIRMVDENNGSYCVQPFWFNQGQTQDNDRAWYLNLENSTRPNYIDKTITLTAKEKTGDDTVIVISMAFDDGLAGAITYSREFPKSLFTATGMDYNNALLEIAVNNNNSTDFSMTILELTDTNSIAYDTSVGTNAKAVLADAVALNGTSIDDSKIRSYYTTRKAEQALSGLRKSDRALKVTADSNIATLDVTYSASVVTNKASLFGGYDDAFTVTDTNLATANLDYYIYDQNKTALNDTDLDSRMSLVLDKIVAYSKQPEIDALDQEISNFLAAYPTVTAANYLAAKSAYATVLTDYNAMDTQISQFLKNKASLLAFQDTLDQGRSLYYSNESTYWASYDGSHNDRSFKDGDATDIIIVDSFGASRIVYGDASSTYNVSLEEFTLVFQIKSLENSGRFAINFGESRDMIPFGSVGKKGISIVFRSSGVGSMDVALKNTADDSGFTFGTPLDSWGKYGALSATSLRNVDITLAFVKSATGYKLTFSVEGTSQFSVTVPSSVFTSASLDPTSLVMNITTGEGGSNMNSGNDIELLVKSVSGAAETAYTTLKTNQTTAVNAISTNASAILSGTFTDENIAAYNTALASYDVSSIRSNDVSAIKSIYDGVNQDNVSQAISTSVVNAIAALSDTIDKNNYDSVLAAYEKAQATYAVLTTSQQSAVSNYARMASIRQALTDYEASTHTTVTEAPTTVTEAPTTVTEAPTTVTEAPTTVTEAPTKVITTTSGDSGKNKGNTGLVIGLTIGGVAVLAGLVVLIYFVIKHHKAV